MAISEEHLKFFKHHKIELKYVFDATGYTRKEYQSLMNELNKFIAYNTNPCGSKHTLKTKSGHCPQCDTAKIAFQKRSSSAGVVYLAASDFGQVVKVGFTKALEIRTESLNRTRYANLKDWDILFAIKSEFAGKIENQSNILLNKYNIELGYEHDGHWQDSHETFHCSYSKARNFIFTICKDNSYSYEILKNSETEKYEFKNLIRKE